MGLAASQARLLTITARKSDCEFQSMRYSHQKIALSRSMTDLSNEYQNSLEQTKLVYDYYGTGDETTPLSYGLLMTPSQLNGYLPTLITDASGKAVLNSQYAAAARAAGIPQEGLGCLPSSDTRNRFLQGLADSGLISQQAADTYMGIQYAQSMGMGSNELVTTKVEKMNINELLEYYAGEGVLTQYNLADGLSKNPSTYSNEKGLGDQGSYKLVNTTQAGRNNDMDNYSGLQNQDLTIQDILNGNYTLLFKCCDDDSKLSTVRNAYTDRLLNDIQNFEVWDWMFDQFESILNVTGDSNIAQAISDARSQTESLLNYSNGLAGTVRATFKEKGEDKKNFQGVMDGLMGYSGDRGSDLNTTDYIGITYARNTKRDGRKSDKFAYGVGISLTNIAKAFLTYFAQSMEGIENSAYKVSDTSGYRTVADSHLIDDQYKFTVVVDTGVNTDQALNSGFYDSIFNQICTRGWVENNNINDNDYMQEMLKTGKFYLATCADDGYYYQGNYATNTYVREVTDEDAIAKAEAKYNTEKQKLTQKEEVLDLKMKNLDTEISSLTTEYDTIKSVISKNIEKSFKRYDA